MCHLVPFRPHHSVEQPDPPATHDDQKVPRHRCGRQSEIVVRSEGFQQRVHNASRHWGEMRLLILMCSQAPCCLCRKACSPVASREHSLLIPTWCFLGLSVARNLLFCLHNMCIVSNRNQTKRRLTAT